MDCDANPDTSSYPEIKTPDNKGSITIGQFAPPGSPPNTPETKVVILTNGFEYGYDTPPPASEVFKPGTMGLNLPEVHLMMTVKVADVDGDGQNDVIATFVDKTTKVYLNPGSNDFSTVTAIEIEAPTTDSITPMTTDVVVFDVNGDGMTDIVTVSDAGENVLYLGTLEFDATTMKATRPGKIIGTDLEYDPATRAYTTGTSTPGDDKSRSQSVQVVDLDGDGDADIIVGNDGAENVVYFQEGLNTGNFPTATPIGGDAFDATSQTTRVVVADLDGDSKLDIIVANRDQENQIFLASASASTVLDEATLPTAPSSTLALPFYNWPDGVLGAEWQKNKLTTEDIAVADFNGDGVLDIVTAEKGAPNMLYLGDVGLPGDYMTVTSTRPILPIPIALKDAPTWYESAYEGTDVATGATIGGNERLTWGQYKGEVDDTYLVLPFDVDGDGDMDLVVGNRDQTAKVYFNDGTGAFEYRTKLGEAYDDGPSAVGLEQAVDSTGLATAVDLNGDGYPDVVTGTEVYLNPGHGEFTNVKGMPWWSPSQKAYLSAPTSIVGVDIDGDGDNDLVVSQPSSGIAGTNANGNIFVLYNPGNGLVADEDGGALNGWWMGPESVQALGLHEADASGDGTTPGSDLDVPGANAMKALDIDNDGDADLVLALIGKPPAIWVNPGLATSGILPTGVTATQSTVFTLDATLATGASDVALADIDGDGRVDVVLAFETGFEVILAPVGGSPTIADWKAAGAAAKKVTAPAKYIMVLDMDNDGYPDIVAAGASASSAGAEKTKTTIYFGSAATKLGGDYSAATSELVGALTYAEAGAVLALDVADVDGDGWMDVAVAYASTYKRLYLGRRGERGWPAAEVKRFGPSSQDAWKLTSLELVDLNLDGNLDVLYAPECTGAACPAYVALGRSKGPIPFDAQAIANQVLRMRAVDFTAGVAGASITDVAVTVNEPNHAHAYAGTTNSECRNPADDFYPVQTRIYIEFPVIPCTKENFKDCILLDPITAMISTVDNANNEGIVSCGYTVDLHRDKYAPAPRAPPTSPPPLPSPPLPSLPPPSLPPPLLSPLSPSPLLPPPPSFPPPTPPPPLDPPPSPASPPPGPSCPPPPPPSPPPSPPSPPAAPPCIVYPAGVTRLDFDFFRAKVVTNNLGGLGYNQKPWPGPPVIRYANVAAGNIDLTSQELLDLFSQDGEKTYTIGDVTDFRFDLVLSNLTKYVQNTNRWNGKSGTRDETSKASFGLLNQKSGFETKFELKLTHSCCRDEDCEQFLCPEVPNGYCNHSLQPRETYYDCSQMNGAVFADGIQMELGIFDMDKDPHYELV